MRRPAAIAVLLTLIAPMTSAAATRYVTDQFEITLRSGESATHSIVRMLPSGTPLEILSVDSETGYTHVRTQSGADGYVLTRFLIDERPAREQLAALRNRLSQADNEQGGLSRQVDELVQKLSEAERSIESLQGENESLSEELARIRAISQDAIRTAESNRELTRQLDENARRIIELSQENEALRRQTSRNWFLAGAGVVVFSMLFGIVLTRIRWKRRSSWSDF